jgi:hypothetical protein
MQGPGSALFKPQPWCMPLLFLAARVHADMAAPQPTQCTGSLTRPCLCHPQALACLVTCLVRTKSSWRSAALVALEAVLGVPGGQDWWGEVQAPLVQSCERHCAAKVGAAQRGVWCLLVRCCCALCAGRCEQGQMCRACALG